MSWDCDERVPYGFETIACNGWVTHVLKNPALPSHYERKLCATHAAALEKTLPKLVPVEPALKSER